MIPQLNKITHTKKVAALSIVIVVSFSRMERRARIELATRTWKDRVIPFYERRVYSNYTTNITVCLCCLAGGIGIEPMRGGIKIRCLTSWRTPNWTGSQYKIWTCDQRLIKTLLYPWANWLYFLKRNLQMHCGQEGKNAPNQCVENFVVDKMSWNLYLTQATSYWMAMCDL